MKSTRHAASASILALAFAGLLTACSDNTENNATANSSPDNAAADASTLKHENVAYVSNQDGHISVVDLDTMQVVGSIDTQSGGPRGIGITDDGKMLVTANKDEGNISVLDPTTGELIRKVEIGKNPEFVRVTGNLAFVSFEPSSKGGPPPKPGTEEAEEEEEHDEDAEPARIAVVDLEQGKKLREIVGGPETEGIEFSGDGKELIITNEADNTITVHNIETGELIKTVDTAEIGVRPRGIKISPDGEIFVSTLEFGNNFVVLDKEYNVVRTVDTGKVPYGISFSPDGKQILVASSKDQLLQVFDAKTFEKIKDIPTGGDRCWHFTYTPDEKQILLTCGRSHEVVVIDADKLEVTQRIKDMELPWGVITYPKSMGSLDEPA
jgi:DNA-binding beta-propeller fold protein YncE